MREIFGEGISLMLRSRFLGRSVMNMRTLEFPLKAPGVRRPRWCASFISFPKGSKINLLSEEIEARQVMHSYLQIKRLLCAEAMMGR